MLGMMLGTEDTVMSRLVQSLLCGASYSAQKTEVKTGSVTVL